MFEYLNTLRTTCLTRAMAMALFAASLPGMNVLAADPVGVVPAVPDVPSLQSLHGLTPPDPSGTEGGRKVDLMTDYVLNRSAAVLLGKALFWDMEIGSDGSTACASCHFHAGVDHRTTNQINPGQANTNANVSSIFNKPFTAADIPGDVPTYTTRSGGKGGPNYLLKKGDFPTHVLADPMDRNSAILYSTDDVIGSQGVFDANFVKPHQARFDKCIQQPDGIFQVGGINVRPVLRRTLMPPTWKMPSGC